VTLRDLEIHETTPISKAKAWTSVNLIKPTQIVEQLSPGIDSAGGLVCQAPSGSG
jgi:hypothetical protein